jgi:hypothetical protein
MSCVELFYAYFSSQERRKPSALCAQPRCGIPTPFLETIGTVLAQP